MTEVNLIQQKIYEIRGEMVMLDFDLAILYEVDTRSLNQAVKRNIERFPIDFMFRLTEKEWEGMISQNVVSSAGRRKKNATPFAFTEHGVAMISGVLKSEKALMMNISIIRMFIEMKRVLIKNASIKGQLQEMRERIGEHDVQLNKIYDTIEHLLDLTMNRVKWNERNIIGFKEDKKTNI
jgi:phage regulator Rha-like protein